MKKRLIYIILFIAPMLTQAQALQDFFQNNNIRVTYLGIDFSHVKLIGNFAEFLEAGQKNVMEIKEGYFPRWNMVVVNEREKYDLAGMLGKFEVYYDIDMISAINAQTPVEELESYNAVKFSENDIRDFVSRYDLGGKEGIGFVFIAESLSKSSEEAFFHFVVIDMDSKEVLFQRRLRGEPNGFGLRNYWINSLHRIINDIKFYYFNEWKYSAEAESDLMTIITFMNNSACFNEACLVNQ